MKLSKPEIEKKVKEILSEVLVAPKESITLNANLAQDLGADSLDNVEIVMYLEEEFGYVIPDTAAEKLETVEDIINYIEEREKDEV